MLAFIFEFGTVRKQYSKCSNRRLKGTFFGSRKGCDSHSLAAEGSEGDADQSVQPRQWIWRLFKHQGELHYKGRSEVEERGYSTWQTALCPKWTFLKQQFSALSGHWNLEDLSDQIPRALPRHCNLGRWDSTAIESMHPNSSTPDAAQEPEFLTKT